MKTKKKRKHSKVEILIAEDSATQREQLQHLLEGHGYKVVAAPDGKQALAAARGRKPTLVISDVMMPELDGYGLCREIKNDQTLEDVPVILLTTLSDVRDIMQGLECGADNFIRKPYEEQYLINRIDYLLMNRELRQGQKMRMGVELYLGGQRHFITAEQQQMVDLMISIYEEAIHLNEELKIRQRELADSNRSLAGLYHVAEGLNRAVSEGEVCEKALEHALELPGVRAGMICLLEGEVFRLAATRNLPPTLLAAGAMEGSCECQRRLLTGALDHVTNILECERLQRLEGDTQDLRYHASVPLWIGGRNLGIMNLVGAEQGLFEDDELETLHGIGHQVGIALERARLHEHLEQLVEERTAALTAEIAQRKEEEAKVLRLNRVYRVLSGINTAIVRVREVQQLFDEACCIAVDQGQFVFAWIGTLDAGTQQVTPVAGAGRDDGYLAQINLTAREDAPGNCPLIARALTQASPVICNDIATDERMKSWRAEALQRGYRSTAVSPLMVADRAAGVFVLYAQEPGVFDEDEMKLLTEIAGDISFALNYLEKEKQVNYLAYYDVLTGLANRTLLAQQLNQLIASAQRTGKMVALIMLDLERFRYINNALGQHLADQLLKAVAQRLRETLSVDTPLARFNADLYALAIETDPDATEVAHFIDATLLPLFAQAFTVDGHELVAPVRIGIALAPADGKDSDTLLKNAEAALKRTKNSEQTYLFYEPAMSVQVAERITLENKLRRALEEEQFVLHYQPKVSSGNNRICGLEALIRWNDPETGLVPPGKFIPIMEETGIILNVGAWAINRALADGRHWLSQGLTPPRIAVNVSALQLQKADFVDIVTRLVAQYGNETCLLELEVTESLLMQDIEGNISKLAAIRDLGVNIAIDDFGTGYSSLGYLAKLPVNALKIDRSFITNMDKQPESMTIVSAIISLAHSLKLLVVAEGVETEAQAQLLRLLNCDELQGYLFSKPLPLDAVTTLLQEWTPRETGH
jgi:diguanylate cyclase (GGDEF)-like protein